MRDRPSFFWFYLVFAWMSVFPVLAIIVSVGLMWHGPKEAHGPAVCYLNPSQDDTYSIIRVEAYISPEGGWTHATLDISATESSPTASAEVDLTLMNVISAYPYTWGSDEINNPPPAYAQPQPLADAEVLTWLGHAGADISKATVQDGAAELATIIRTIPQHSLENLTPTHYEYTLRASVIYLPAIWFVKALVTFWFVVWILGFLLIWRIHRKYRLIYFGTSEPVV